MADQRKNEPQPELPGPWEGKSDEEILRLLEEDAAKASQGQAASGENTGENASAKALRGLKLLREAASGAAGGVEQHLRELLGDELAKELVLPSPAGSRFQFQPGTMIAGRYRLVSLIGEGGMGSVWVAEQKAPIRRRVALKLIKPGMDSRQVLHRFEAERQALAAMDHPNIARVLDGGLTENQHPYFAMELVNGASLTKFCDEARLGIRERLDIFSQITLAIQHAHHKGILHRDLKPSNILVTVIDGKPVPKVIDFGLAKVLGSQLHADSMQTGFGAVVGTIEYMAPEQAGYSGQDVDTRADIYSLGVILYELLTGLRPFDSDRLASAALDEMLRIIKDEDPARPSIRLTSSASAQSCADARRIEPAKLSGILRNELDWIVMKALDKDRNRRYETARGLATDIQNFLVGEPVSAHPPSTAYRIRKFVRRHRLQVVAASLVTFALIAGIAGMAVGLFHARKQERIAIKQEQIAVAESKAKTEALQREKDARENEKEARDQALAALRAMTDEFVQSELSREPRISRKEQTYLRNIIRQFDAFSNFSDDDAEGAAIRAEGRFRVGRVYNYLSETTEAEVELSKSAELYADLVQKFPESDEYRRRLARSQGVLGNVLAKLGREDEARLVLEEAAAFWNEVATSTPTAANLEACANAKAAIARLLMDMRRLDVAETSFREILVMRRKIMDLNPRPESRADVAGCLNELANLCRKLDKKEEADAFRDEAFAIRKQIARRFSARPDFTFGLSTSFAEMGNAAIENRQWSDAESAFQEAVQLLEELGSQFPSRFEYKEKLADALTGLARAFENQNRDRETMTALARAIVLREELVTDSPERPEFRKDLAALNFSLGRAYRRLGLDEEAGRAWQQAISLRDSLASEFAGDSQNALELARVLLAFGLLRNSTGQVDEAIKCCERAVQIRKEWVAHDPARIQWRKLLAASLLDLGRILSGSARATESEAVLLESRAIWQQLASDDPDDAGLQSEVADGSIELGAVCIKRSDFEAAEQYLAEAMRIIQKGLESDAKATGFRARHVRSQFFLIQVHAGKLDEARSLSTAAELRDLGWSPAENAYFAACGLARSVPIVTGHAGLDEKARQEAVLRYSNLAMEYLTDAVNKGFAKSKTLDTDTDLDPLRDREDFRKLLDGVLTKSQAGTVSH